MKPRRLLSAGEVDALLATIQERLKDAGIQTQPEVASQIVELASDPDAGLRQYAEAIQTDPTLSGRLLRLANSAFFAQRQPVTNLDRACVLLGLERIKAISLGFHLSRAAGAGKGQDLSRRIWGEGVYRACLCAELSRGLCPRYTSEAFVIGLMLDCGVPLLPDLLGRPAQEILDRGDAPLRQFRAEFENLPFTHVDVAAVLARRWRLPELLAKPIERHHTPPADGGKPEPIHLLHRVAYYVGALQLDCGGAPRQEAPMPAIAGKILGMTSAELADVISRAGREYGAMSEMFREVAQTVNDVGALADQVQRQLVEVLDETLATQFRAETRQPQGSFLVGGQRIDLELEREGAAIAYLVDAEGNRLLSHAFNPGQDALDLILEALGIDSAPPGVAAEITQYIHAMAA